MSGSAVFGGPEVDEKMAELNAMPMASVRGKTLTRGELLAVFNLVTAGMENWKMPIDATVPRSALANYGAGAAEVINEAVKFFAGCTAEVTGKRSTLHVKAVGYYAAVGS